MRGVLYFKLYLASLEQRDASAALRFRSAVFQPDG
jgi:hypothetical protein